MNSIEKIQNSFSSFLQNHFEIGPEEAALYTFDLNTQEAKGQFGDISSNVALILSKKLKKNPATIAQEIVDTFKHEYIKDLTAAGPGFINAFLTDSALATLVQELFREKDLFFKAMPHGTKNSYNIEFVSANPTGPLHFGHGRGGIIGDVLGNILRFLGNEVTKEFYVNDAGSQIQKLARSFKIRCEQQLSKNVQLPEAVTSRG